MPSPRNRSLAKRAPSIVDIEGSDGVPLSIDQELVAVVAIGIAGIMAWDIADIHIAYPFLQRDIP